MNKLILEKYVSKFRAEHGLGADDPIRLKSLLSKLNVITVFKPLGENFSGMAIRIDADDSPSRFIMVNSTHSKGKQHFTICHELYHLFIQQSFHSMVCNTAIFKKGTGEEFNADVFASYLLLPEHGLKSLIPDEELAKDKISLKTIVKIEHYFSCSRTALLYRLKDLSLITSSTYDRYCKNVKRSAIRYGYATDLYEPANQGLIIGDYGELARDLYENNIVSESHYFSLMKDSGMSESDLENLFNAEEG